MRGGRHAALRNEVALHYVPGNHEYYKSSPKQVARNMAKLAKEVPKLVIPENETVVIASQRF